MMKMTVLYHSVTGNTKTMAQVIAEGMMTVAGVEAKAFPIENWDAAWVKESKCVVLGTPIYLADLCSAVKVWLDGPALKAGLAGKVGVRSPRRTISTAAGIWAFKPSSIT